MKLISGSEVADCYRSRYWDPMGCATLDFPWALCKLDAAVQHGPTLAKKLASMASSPERFIEIREDFYRDIAQHRPSQQVFLKGWLNRMQALRQAIA